jgi:hypothetical protein
LSTAARQPGFIPKSHRIGISSYEKANLKINPDGTIDLYFGPKAPAGMESNWIPTGEEFFLIFRLSWRTVKTCSK